jgi:hypothetical protein
LKIDHAGYRKSVPLPIKTKSNFMKPILIILLFIAGVACTKQLYVPSAKNVNKVEQASLAELQQGHDLMLANCSKCHKVPMPNSHSNIEWKGILEKMAPKAKLNSDQSYLIYRYIVNN